MHFLRQPADVVMTLDHVRRVAADCDTFDHVGIERSLREKTIAAVFGSCGLPILLVFGREAPRSACFEDGDEFVADNFSFLFRIGNAAKFFKKTFGRVDVLQSDVKIFSKNALHHFFLARAQADRC